MTKELTQHLIDLSRSYTHRLDEDYRNFTHDPRTTLLTKSANDLLDKELRLSPRPPKTIAEHSAFPSVYVARAPRPCSRKSRARRPCHRHTLDHAAITPPE